MRLAEKFTEKWSEVSYCEGYVQRVSRNYILFHWHIHFRNYPLAIEFLASYTTRVFSRKCSSPRDRGRKEAETVGIFGTPTFFRAILHIIQIFVSDISRDSIDTACDTLSILLTNSVICNVIRVCFGLK